MATIEIIVDRNPDGPTNVDVYVDGVQNPPGIKITNIDPGNGYTIEDWIEIREHAANNASSPEIAAFIRGSFSNYDNSQFISD